MTRRANAGTGNQCERIGPPCNLQWILAAGRVQLNPTRVSMREGVGVCGYGEVTVLGVRVCGDAESDCNDCII